MSNLIDRYAELIGGRLTCWDRVVIAGSLPDLVHKDGVYAYMRQHGVEVGDLERHFKKLNLEIRATAEDLASRAGLQIDYIRRSNFRKEDRIAEAVRERGDHPYVLAVLTTGCNLDRITGRDLTPRQGR